MNTCYGVVTDDSNNKPIQGIVVSIVQNGTGQIEAPGLSDITDAGGNFSIENVPNNDGDSSVFVSFNDPTGKYGNGVYGFTTDEIDMSLAPGTAFVIPTWVWFLLGAVVLYFGYVGYKKGYFNKLLKL